MLKAFLFNCFCSLSHVLQRFCSMLGKLVNCACIRICQAKHSTKLIANPGANSNSNTRPADRRECASGGRGRSGHHGCWHRKHDDRRQCASCPLHAYPLLRACQRVQAFIYSPHEL